MRIAIIGAGRVGGALATGLKGKGHLVTFGVRDAGKAEAQALAVASGASLATPSAAARASELIILALPWRVAEAAVKGLGDLSGKIVIDCMNPLGMVDGALGLMVGHTSSGGEIVAGWLPGARVVKTLNQVGAEIMADTAAVGRPPVMFMAGDDAEAKAATAGLLGDLGFEPLDAGDITKARLLEPFGMVWINQAIMRGKGRDWAFSITRNGT
jgi:8-hydroxy-5-deazaflavin:NADPH oxidoreductase